MMRIFLFVYIFLAVQVTTQLSYAQTNLSRNRACYQSSAANYNNTAHLTTDGSLSTSWISKNTTAEWLYVDLGVVCKVSGIRIHWDKLYAASYTIQVSKEGTQTKPVNWTTIYSTEKGKGNNESVKLQQAACRYVRINCNKPGGAGGYSIKEFEVYGTGQSVLASKPLPPVTLDGKQYLTDGNWKVQRKAFVPAGGSEISQNKYNDAEWIRATVPGTVLSSYLDMGAIPDPNYGDQQLMISESFFTSDFWYRNTFNIPLSYKGKKIWLNFDGINWKADIYLNGRNLGNIKGAFIRGKFDVTDYIKVGEENSLAVLILKNDNPGEVTEQHLEDPDANGGIIGYDSPSFLSSIGWNWMPTIRGRNTGIWNDVYLSSTGSVSIEDPFIKTNFALPDTTKAAIAIEVSLRNHADEAVSGILSGTIGDVQFQKEVIFQAGELKTVNLDPRDFPQLLFLNPRLWWPNGYGQQPLYKLALKYKVENSLSDQKEVAFGIREYTYAYEDNNLRLFINGHPLVIRGGNWGMAESMLRCDKAGYDLRVKLHKDMNLNMIRNWVGMVGDDEFYEACNKYGIMIWDDFWLANPLDGPDPKDNAMFLSNVKDKIKRVRNHASLALWCGRNEGFPNAYLDSAMKDETTRLDGSRHYVSSSADRPVTGLGPYEIKDPKWYFEQRGTTFHTEQGLIAVPTIEGIREMMPEEYVWPISDMWGKHDWTQARVKIYSDDLDRSYGKAISLLDFHKKAQMMNTEGPKAMMETWQSNRGAGGIVWMTHPAWPSFICQTYDYYFEPTAAYFALKKGSEPVHVLWRADNEKVQVVNNTLHTIKDVSVQAFIYNMDGKLILKKTGTGAATTNSVVDMFALAYPKGLTEVHFIKLELKDRTGRILSENFYWRGTSYMNYTALAKMGKANLTGKATIDKRDSLTVMKVTLSNNNSGMAVMVRLKLLKKETGKRVLPVFYEDNYISLVPGESKTIHINFEDKDLGIEEPQLMIEGWNQQEKEIPISKAIISSHKLSQ